MRVALRSEMVVGGGFSNDVFGRGGGTGNRAGAGNIADGAETDITDLGNFAFAFWGQRGNGNEQAVAFDNFALVGVINRRQGEFFACDVLPDVQFRPVGNREYAHVFALEQACVVERP